MALEEASSCRYLLRVSNNTETMASAIVNKIIHVFSEVDQFKIIAENYKWILSSDMDQFEWIKKEIAKHITLYIDSYYIKSTTEYTITCTKTHVIIIHIELLVINIYLENNEIVIERAIHESRRNSSVKK